MKKGGLTSGSENEKGNVSKNESIYRINRSFSKKTIRDEEQKDEKGSRPQELSGARLSSRSGAISVQACA